MIDIKFLRENPDIVKENIKNKFQEQKLVLVDEVIELDKKNREVKLNGDNLRSERKNLSAQIGGLMKNGQKEEAEKIKQQVQKINEELDKNEKLETEINGVYAIGDIINKDTYQLVTAAADGARVITNMK